MSKWVLPIIGAFIALYVIGMSLAHASLPPGRSVIPCRAGIIQQFIKTEIVLVKRYGLPPIRLLRSLTKGIICL